MDPEQIKPYIGQTSIVRLIPNYLGDAESGLVLAVSHSIVLVGLFNDAFKAHGYAVLCLSDIERVERQPRFTEMVAGENRKQELAQIPAMRLDSLQTVLEDLQERDCNIKVECNNCGDAEEAGFHIGRIISIGNAKFDFVFFSSEGEWFKTPYSIPMKSVTRIEFDTEYLVTLSRYIDGCPVPRRRPNKPLAGKSG